MKKMFVVGCVCYFFLFNISFSELKESKLNDEMNSVIGLTIDGSPTTTFPTKESGYAIDSIVCDKGANGVWDYELWTLKVRNITQSRTKCQINFVSKYTEGILNGTDPVLKDGLIPVTIDNDGVVKKSSLGWEWYDYETRQWANAVILNDETEVYYDGEVIPEEVIESYFVWIPRYKYKIFDMGKYEGLTSVNNKQQTIDVIFGTETTSDTSSSCKTPNQSGASGTCSIGKYMTHPAFTSFGTNGMWVGKFETGYKGATTAEEAQVNENNPSKIQIKPNVYSWKGINVSNAYLSSYNYKREMDSHLMKNTEWGAVSYLQHSKYGSGTSVRINNNEAYLTGYASKKEPTCGYTATNEECNKYESTAPGVDGTYTISWNRTISVDVYGALASTTSNITGVYDMSGGAWEYMMGVMKSSNGSLCSGRDATYNSGFNGAYCGITGTKTDGEPFPTNSKYYDVYEYATGNEEYNRRILGDATGEMGPFSTKQYESQNRQVGSWYDDEAWFVATWSPWSVRGARYDGGSYTGVFALHRDHGSVVTWVSFRVILSI